MKRLIALALVCCSTQAFAADRKFSYFKDGNELLTQCTSSSAYDQGVCLGYVIGAADGLGPRFVAIPENVTAGQTQDVVIKYLRNHPESRNGPAGPLIMFALMEAWPKPKPAQK